MTATVNGEKPTSAFISHLTSYPVISDSISTFKSNPYGAKSLNLADKGYSTLLSTASPIVPYVQNAYQYVSPYVSKVDSLGDTTLSKVDARFPTIKKPTGELYDNAQGLIFLPYKKTVESKDFAVKKGGESKDFVIKKGTEGKDYVLTVYHSEYKKVGGQGVVTAGTAALTTSLIVGSDALSWLSAFLSAKKEQGKDVYNEKKDAVNEKVSN